MTDNKEMIVTAISPAHVRIDPAPAKELTPVQQLMKDVSDNPVNLKWPRDVHGNTAGLKKEVLRAASNVRGNADKHDVLLNTLAVAIAHIQKRRAKDVAYTKASRDVKQAAELERAPRQRVSAASITPTENTK